ncbi:hypothetical protein BJ875DRAFT_1353 [Amylocarpus encephaloides]|uniref:Secreted protein n=1 Tax=Amylocarpus encephaloides TaxID=45428 RepID=A0A9P7YTY6_9HELO|nr:hypothetical protein BJ875DRAFT_1353 [Amylocarpus encephaloides]
MLHDAMSLFFFPSLFNCCTCLDFWEGVIWGPKFPFRLLVDSGGIDGSTPLVVHTASCGKTGCITILTVLYEIHLFPLSLSRRGHTRDGVLSGGFWMGVVGRLSKCRLFLDL